VCRGRECIERASERRRLRTGALATAAATRARMPGVVRAGRGGLVRAAGGLWWCVLRAMRMRGAGVSNRPRLQRRHISGHCHLAQEHDERNQTTMSQPSHRRSVSPPASLRHPGAQWRAAITGRRANGPSSLSRQRDLRDECRCAGSRERSAAIFCREDQAAAGEAESLERNQRRPMRGRPASAAAS
jgi:hypothetical protein